MIVSDHGFHSWRKAVNLEHVAGAEGYMVLKGQQRGRQEALGSLRRRHVLGERRLEPTRAYAMGIGQIYFNLRGRESQGIVSPGAEATQLADELAAKLLTMKDPDDGTPIIRAVYKRDDIYTGPYLQNAAELQVGMNDGYRVSWQTTLGGSPPGIVYKNERKWSADHGGYDFADDLRRVRDRAVRSSTQDAAHHRHRADGAAVLRSLDSDGYRWQAALLSVR